MRPTRVILAVAAGALAPALLLATPSMAAPSAPAVTTATAGSPYDEMSAGDLRVAISRILGGRGSGKRVIREANALLDSGPVEEMRAWLETVSPLAQAEDDRVALARILADPDSGRGGPAGSKQVFDNANP